MGISVLLYASSERALQLNKAYRVIVEEQSFTQGRDAVIQPTPNVLKEVESNQSTGIKKSIKKMPLILGSSKAYISDNLDLFFPLINYSGKPYSARFFLENLVEPVWLLNQFDLVSRKDFDQGAVVREDFGISIPFITDGENAYSAEMSYVGEKNNQYYWTLRDYQLLAE